MSPFRISGQKLKEVMSFQILLKTSEDDSLLISVNVYPLESSFIHRKKSQQFQDHHWSKDYIFLSLFVVLIQFHFIIIFFYFYRSLLVLSRLPNLEVQGCWASCIFYGVPPLFHMNTRDFSALQYFLILCFILLLKYDLH